MEGWTPEPAAPEDFPHLRNSVDISCYRRRDKLGASVSQVGL